MESPISAACRWNAMDWSDGCPVSPRRQRGAPPEKPVEHETGNRTLLLIGAPIATEGLAWAIRGEYPNCRILRAFYAPYRTLKEL